MDNLSTKPISDSAKATRIFFERYGQSASEFKPDDVSGTIGFFQSRGFEEDVAILTALSILKAAKRDQTPVFQILDTIRTFDGVQLSVVVSRILNQNRLPISVLGYRSNTGITENVLRNIRP
jgi:hypothetical protein